MVWRMMKKNRILFVSMLLLLTVTSILIISIFEKKDNVNASEKVELSQDEQDENKIAINNVSNQDINSIEYVLFGNNIITIQKDRIYDEFYGIQQLNNSWELSEINTILSSIKGTWKPDKYIGFVDSSLYFPDLFDGDKYLEEDYRKQLYDEYNTKIENAKVNIPTISISVKENYGKEISNNLIFVNGYYLSPISIVFSLDRINENYPVFVDQTTISKDFYVEYPTIYIKFFIPVEDEKNQISMYRPATLVISRDNKFYLLIDGAFYSLENLSNN